MGDLAKSATKDAIAVVGAVAGVAATPGPVPSAVALAAVFPPIVLGLLNFGFEARRVAVARWWSTLTMPAADDDITSEEIAGQIEAHADEPFVRETVLRSARMLFETIDDVAVVPLGILAREYLRTNNAPDAFFRGAAGLLGALGRSDYRQLQDLLDWMLTFDDRAPKGATQHFSASKAGVLGHFTLEPEGGERQVGREQIPGEPKVIAALLRLLERHDLLAPTPVFGGLGYAADVATVARLRRLLVDP